MSVFARVALAALTLLAGCLAAVGLASPAEAASKLKLCVNDNYKYVCEYRLKYDTNFKNDCWYDPWGSTGPYKVPSCNKGWWFNDETSSVKNPTPYWWKLYEHTKYGGFAICLRPRGYDANLGNNTKYEDDISSVKRFGTRRPGGCDQVIG